MKRKTLLCLAIALSIMLAAMPALKAQPYASMEVLFVAINDTPITPTSELFALGLIRECDNITVAVHITDVVDMWSWKVRVTWDPTMLEITAAANTPHFANPWEAVFGDYTPEITPAPPTIFLGVPSVGEIPELSSTSMASPIQGRSGTGNMAYIKFHLLKDLGETYIRLLDVDVINAALEPIIIDPVTPGHLEVWWGFVSYPWARFTPEHCTFVYVGENITLDASASEGGWDWVPIPGEYCPILNYTWEIDLGNDGSVDFTLDGEMTQFPCEAPGDVGITLIIYAPDPTRPNTHPDYDPYNDPDYRDEWNTETHVVHQITIGIGPAIDVYTDRGGEGPGYDEHGDPYPYPTSWSDAYGPQENVTVYALVTYKGEPVEHKPVAFEIKDPNGTTRVTRTAFTDANGIATTWFRIPWEGAEAEDMFGVWKILGTADVAEVVYRDICQFKFGYILNIADVIVSGSPLHKTDPLSIQADIDNLSWLSKEAFMAITLYDECGVPIGMATDTITVPGEDGLTAIYTITIPDWAFIGVGAAYVNLYTAQPSLGGTPWCPEKSNVFIIEKA